jgi:hypothetical protein
VEVRFLITCASTNRLSTLFDLLHTWCRAAGAKFNVPKTVIIPVGPQTYREEVVESRKLTQDQLYRIEDTIKILKDGETPRILGASIGNHHDRSGPWAPIMEQIDASLERWNRIHPSIEGHRHIINMVIGGMSQYLTTVQGMPPAVLCTLKKRTCEFVTDSSSPLSVNFETYLLPYDQGGQKILDLEARNEAIVLMQLKQLMNYSTDRPLCTDAARALILRSIPNTEKQLVDREARIDIFQQNCMKEKHTHTQEHSQIT